MSSNPKLTNEKILARFDELEQKYQEMHNRVNTYHSLLKRDISCMKYEVKKLKYGSNQSQNTPNDSTSTTAASQDKMKKDIVTIQSDIKKLKKKLNDIESISSINEIRTTIDQLKTQVDNIPFSSLEEQEQIRKDSQCVRCLKYEMRNLKARLRQESENPNDSDIVISGDNSKLKKEMDSLKQEIQQLKQQDQSSNANIQDLDKRIKTISTAQTKMKKDISALQADVKNLKSNGIQIVDGDSSVKVEVSEHTSETIIQTRQISSVKSQGNITADIPPEIIASRLAAIEKQATDSTTKLTKLRGEYDKTKKSVTTLLADIKKLKQPEEIGDYTEQIQQFRNFTDKAKFDLSCLKYEVKKLKQGIDENDSNLFQERAVTNIEGDAPAVLQDTIESLKSEQGNMKKVLMAMHNDLSQLKEKTAKELGAYSKAEEAGQKARDASEKAATATQKSADATKKASSASKKAVDAASKADTADKNASEANQSAKDALQKANAASQSATDAVQKLNETNQQVGEANKKANDAMENAKLADQKASDAKTKLDALKSANDILSHELKAIKDDLQQLKNKPVETAPPVISVSNNAAIDKLHDENSKVMHDLKCIKYEIKKLKEQAPSVKERAVSLNDDSSVRNDIQQLQEKISNIPALDKDDYDLLKKESNTIRCLKYEILKLKKQGVPSNSDNTTTRDVVIPADIQTTLNNANKSAKNASKNATDAIEKAKLADQKATNAQTAIDSLKDLNDKLNNEIKAIKSEMKKLKDKPTTVQQSSQPSSNEELERVRDENAKLNHDMKCLKYEVKKLIEQSKQVNQNVTTRDVVIPADIQTNLDNANKLAKSASKNATDAIEKAKLADQKATNAQNAIDSLSKQLKSIQDQLKSNSSQQSSQLDTQKQITALDDETSKLVHDYQCLKYEVKKLKFNSPSITSTVSSDLSALQKSIDDIKSNQDKLNDSVNTIKTDIRKLKKSPPKQNEATDPNDFEDRIHKIEENDKNETNQIDQLNGLSEKVVKELRCLKYEMKKLIQAIETPNQPVHERAVPLEIDNNDLDGLKQQIKELSKTIDNKGTSDKGNQAQNTEIKNSINDLKRQVLRFNDLDEQRNHEIACLKYEVKKLKSSDTQSSNNVVVQSGDSGSIQKQLNDYQSKQNKENQKLQDDIKNLKSKIENGTEKNPVNDSLIEKVEKQANSANEKAANVENTVNEMKKALRDAELERKGLREGINDVKSEIDGIRSLPSRRSSSHVSETSEPISKETLDVDDIMDDIEYAKEKADRAINKVDSVKAKVNEAQRQISTLNDENDKINRDIKCLKYELKRLRKDASSAAPIQERSVPHVENNQDFDDIIRSIDQIKFDISNLKSQQQQAPIVQQQRVVFNNSNNDSSDAAIADINNENKRLKHSVSCLKYEVKRLKQMVWPEKENQEEDDGKAPSGSPNLIKYEMKRSKISPSQKNGTQIESQLIHKESPQSSNEDLQQQINELRTQIQSKIDLLTRTIRNTSTQRSVENNEGNEATPIEHKFEPSTEIERQVEILQNENSELKVKVDELIVNFDNFKTLIANNYSTEIKELDNTSKYLGVSRDKFTEEIEELRFDVDKLKAIPQIIATPNDINSEHLRQLIVDLAAAKAGTNVYPYHKIVRQFKIYDEHFERLDKVANNQIQDDSVIHDIRRLKYEVKKLKKVRFPKEPSAEASEEEAIIV